MFLNQLDERDEAVAQQILQAFESQDQNGDFLFSDADVRHFLPCFLLMSGVDPNDHPTGSLGELFRDFRISSGTPDDATVQEYVERATAFYDASPPSEELLKTVRELVNKASW